MLQCIPEGGSHKQEFPQTVPLRSCSSSCSSIHASSKGTFKSKYFETTMKSSEAILSAFSLSKLTKSKQNKINLLIHRCHGKSFFMQQKYMPYLEAYLESIAKMLNHACSIRFLIRLCCQIKNIRILPGFLNSMKVFEESEKCMTKPWKASCF